MSLTCPKCNGHKTESLVAIDSATDPPHLQGPAQPPLPQLAAPPKKGSYLHIFEFWFLGTMVMDLVSKMLHLETLGGLAILTIFVASVYALLRAYNFNKNEWPRLFQKWQHSYICLQCRNIFQSGGGEQGKR